MANLTRHSIGQGEHDAVVVALAQQVRSQTSPSIRVDANPGSQKNVRIGADMWPDVIVWDEYQKKTHAIFEVETAETVTEQEASSQWVPYAQTGIAFTLVVPRGSGSQARLLMATRGISVNVIEYSYSILGGTSFFAA